MGNEGKLHQRDDVELPCNETKTVEGHYRQREEREQISGKWENCLGLRGSQRGPPIYLQRMKRDGTGGAKERQQDKGF